MPFYTAVERGMLQHVFLKTIYTTALPFTLALLDDEYNELDDQPGYARIDPVEPADFSWPMTGGVISNAVNFVFPVATANWTREAAYFALYDSTGQLFLADPLEIPFTALQGEVPVFREGAMQIVMASYTMSIKYGVAGHNALSNYLKDRLLRHIFGKEVYTPPDIWVGLLTSDPGDVLTNTDCGEVVWGLGNYMRMATSPSTWESSMAEIWNKAAITFPEAQEDWGLIEHFALFDVSSPGESGNALFHGPVKPAKSIIAGSLPKFNITVPGTGTGVYDELGIGFAIL